MIRRRLSLPGLLVLSALCACDSAGTITLVPEFEASFDFEAGLEGWNARSANLGAGTEFDVTRVSGAAAGGEGSLRIAASAPAPGGRVWIARSFQVTPEQAYEVTLTYWFGTTDDAATTAWDVLAGASPAALTGPELTVWGTTTPETAPDPGLVWEQRTHTLTVQSGPPDEGQGTATVQIGLGLGIPTADDREYGFDDIEVSFLRND